MREPIPDNLRRRVFNRDGKKCRYCGKTEGAFHIDHVYPVSKGGETTFENLVVACKGCNLRKHNKVGMWPKPIGYFDIPDRNFSEIVIRIPRINFEYVAHSYSVILGLAGIFMTILFFVMKSDEMFIDEKSINSLLIMGLSFSAIGVSVYNAEAFFKRVTFMIMAGIRNED